MKTFYVVTSKLNFKGTAWEGRASSDDYAIFDSPWEMEAFVEDGVGLNAIDDYCKVRSYETLNKVFCILAKNYLDAIDRASELCRR